MIARGNLLPAFSQLTNHRHRFVCNGYFRIHKAERMVGQPVLALLAQRGDSRHAKDPRVWEDKVNAEWLKVTAERVRREEQKEYPIILAKKRLEGDRHPWMSSFTQRHMEPSTQELSPVSY